MPDGIEATGVIEDLEPLYKDAGVVISPLRIGSGLKIKLIEALSRGKAVVGTSITLQGVQDTLADSIAIEDAPQRFAEAVARLLGDKKTRTDLASRGLRQIRAHFTRQNCYGEFVDEVVRHASSLTACPRLTAKGQPKEAIRLHTLSPPPPSADV